MFPRFSRIALTVIVLAGVAGSTASVPPNGLPDSGTPTIASTPDPSGTPSPTDAIASSPSASASPAPTPPPSTEPPPPPPPTIIPACPSGQCSSPVGQGIDPNRPVIALTFDDGPSAHTKPLVDLFTAHGAHATFFVLGNLVDPYSNEAAAIVNAGSEIMGHSWDHSDLTKLTPQQIRDQFTMTNSAIQRTTGVMPNAYRPPYGSLSDAVKAVSQETGLSIITWNVDTQDWLTRDAQQVHDWVMTHAKPNAIILCHELYESTVEAMRTAIPGLIAQGYQLVTVSQLLQAQGVTMEPGVVYDS